MSLAATFVTYKCLVSYIFESRKEAFTALGAVVRAS